MDESFVSGCMNYYEKGRYVLDVEMLCKIVVEFNVLLNYFFCEDELSVELVCLIFKFDEESKRILIVELMVIKNYDSV